MRLRNKKTGEIIDLTEGFIKDTYNGEMIQIKPVAISNKEGYLYGSLAELNKDWEDYTLAEPLIKDEKIRKAIRAWANANGIEQVTVERSFSTYTFYPADTDRVSISVWTEPSLSNLSKDKTYTIEELCGEEEG